MNAQKVSFGGWNELPKAAHEDIGNGLACTVLIFKGQNIVVAGRNCDDICRHGSSPASRWRTCAAAAVGRQGRGELAARVEADLGLRRAGLSRDKKLRTASGTVGGRGIQGAG